MAEPQTLPEPKPARRSKVLLFNGLAAAVAALLTVADSFEPFLPPDFYKAALAVVVVVNAVLRIYTTQPVCLRGGARKMICGGQYGVVVQ